MNKATCIDEAYFTMATCIEVAPFIPVEKAQVFRMLLSINTLWKHLCAFRLPQVSVHSASSV
jgi:hypothetical protein